jgi:hypothetical protein
MHEHAKVLSYDIKKYPFERILSAYVFKVPCLKNLHIYWSKQKGGGKNSYQDNLKLRKVMQRMKEDSPFYKLYHHWIANVLAPHYGYKVGYSAHPKMRVHLAGTGSVSDFHRDADVTRREEQINCFLPFTDVFDTNSLWCEVDYGSKIHEPVNLRYGEALIWDGGYLEHGTVRNETELTRVSCDFRFIYREPELVESPWSDILAGRPSHLKRIEPAP